VTSGVIFALAYHDWNSGPRGATVISFCAGALVNFLTFRFWAWRSGSQPRLGPDEGGPSRRAVGGAVGRDFVKFAVVAVATALVALGATTLADGYARHAGLDPTTRTIVVEGSYFGAFALMFVAKFLVLDRFVFGVGASEATLPSKSPP
jgi:hypothetical protein